MTPQEYDGQSPVHRCRCGNAIGDGDWASGKRDCALHRRRRPRR